jgi:hypothetical protein
MIKIIYLLIVLLFMGCAAQRQINPLLLTTNENQSFEKIRKTFSELGYPIEYADKEAGIINTGWYSFTIVRGLLKIAWAGRIRLMIVVDNKQIVRLRTYCEVALGSIFGGFFVPLQKHDSEGNKAFDIEFLKVKEALSKEFKIQIEDSIK